MVGAGARAKIFDKLEPEPYTNLTGSASRSGNNIWLLVPVPVFD
jgi:hypothetical protein